MSRDVLAAAESLPADLQAALSGEAHRLPGGTRLHCFGDVASTNDIALTLAASGAIAGTAVLAESQHAGRGRHGRSWASPPGAGVYLSVVARAAGFGADLPLVTLASGVAAARALEAATGLRAELKWPNDVVVGRPWKKLAGVLCESSGVGARVDAVVIGLGINVRPASHPPDLAATATSLETELGRSVDRARVIVELLCALGEALDDLRLRGPGPTLAAWREFGGAGLAGAAVRWTDAGGERRGRASDIDATGALIVETEGATERVSSGEVRWERWSRG